MYCVHCGANGAIKFCPACGMSQQVEGVTSRDRTRPSEALSIVQRVDPPNIDVPVVVDQDVTTDWTEHLNYQEVLAVPQARDRIAAAAWGITPGLTADDLLAIFDAVSPVGVSLQKLNSVMLPIYDKIGVKTLRWARGTFAAPPGRVLLALLCVFAKKSLEVTEVHQEPLQCGLTVKIPSSLYTNQGQLLVLLRSDTDGVHLEIRTRISGQYFDWGRSKRLIDDLFSGIRDDLTNQLAGPTTRYSQAA